MGSFFIASLKNKSCLMSKDRMMQATWTVEMRARGLNAYSSFCADVSCCRPVGAVCAQRPSPHSSPHRSHQRLPLSMRQNPAGDFDALSPSPCPASSRRARPADESWQALPVLILVSGAVRAAGHALFHHNFILWKWRMTSMAVVVVEAQIYSNKARGSTDVCQVPD